MLAVNVRNTPLGSVRAFDDRVSGDAFANAIGRHEGPGGHRGAKPEKLQMLLIELAPQRPGVGEVGPQLAPRLPPFLLLQQRQQRQAVLTPLGQHQS